MSSVKSNERSVSRCITAHRRPMDQNLFAIVQGGLQPELRRRCVEGETLPAVQLTAHPLVIFRHQLILPPAMVKRDMPGYAIGGLSGGEEKDIFWRIVSLCTDLLPRSKPRYVMGIG